VLCAVTIPPADSRSLSLLLLRSMWPHVYVICACLVFLSVPDKNTKHAQMTYTCGHILRNNYKLNTNQREE
jgi:hypothetical protein